jgi:hypothetical protein
MLTCGLELQASQLQSLTLLLMRSSAVSGQDYKEAGEHLNSLEARLSATTLAELKQRLEALSSAPDDEAVSVADLQAAVAATLPRIIAVNWEPEGGKNQLDATVTNVLARLKNTGSASALKRSSAKVSPAAVATAVLRGGAKVPATDGVRTANVGKKDASTVEKYEVEAEEEAGLQFSSGGSEVATTVTSH